MNILSVVILIFILLELSNVLILYFKPEFKYGNAINVFDGWEKSKQDTNMHNFIKYLVFWVAGTKLIFIMLLLVILFTGSKITKILTVISLILSISTFYFKLYPIIKELDNNNQITPKGYSKTLRNMINVFMISFCIALIFSLL